MDCAAVVVIGAVECLAHATAISWSILIGASLVAAVLDLRSRRIPNWLTAPLAASGLLAALWQGGPAELGWAFAGCVLLTLPFFILFTLGHGGAGDAKMMGAIGAWLGLEAGMAVLVAVTLTGGALALLRMAADRQRRRYFGNLAVMLYVWMIGVCSGRRGLALLRSEPGITGDSPQIVNGGHVGSPRQETALGDSRQPAACCPTPSEEHLTMPYGPAIFIGLSIVASMAYVRGG